MSTDIGWSGSVESRLGLIIWGFVGNIQWTPTDLRGRKRRDSRTAGNKVALVPQWQWEELAEFWLLSVRQPPGVISVSRMCSCLPSSTKLELLPAVGLPRYQLLAPFCFLNTDCIKWKSPSFSIPYKTFFLVTYSIICPFISTKLKVCC